MVDKIKSRFVKLINIISVDSKETINFKGIHHDKLVNALKYWFEQSRLFFGEPIVIQLNQSTSDAGVDIILHFSESDYKIGIQIKSHFDISEDSFLKNVKSQMVDRLRHNLNFYLIGFAGDMTNKSHIEKVGRMMSEISQTNDKSVLVLQPEQVYPLFRAYINKIHPLKLVNLDYNDCVVLSKGMRESLLTKDNEVSIKIRIKNKKVFKNKNTIHNFSVNFRPTEKNIEKLDELNNVLNSDNVLTIYPHEIDFTIESGIQENGETTKLTIFREGSNRKVFFLDSIWNNDEIIRHEIIYDKQIQDGISRLIDSSDRIVKINMTFNPDLIIHPTLDFDKMPTKSMKTLLQDIRYWYSIRLAKYSVLSMDGKAVLKIMTPALDFPDFFTEIVFLLVKLESFINKTFTLREEDLTFQNHNLLKFLTDSIQNKEVDLKYYINNVIEFSLDKKIALRMLNDIKDQKILGSAFYKLAYKLQVMNQQVYVELPVDLFHLKSDKDIYEEIRRIENEDNNLVAISLTPNTQIS
jgi:hypothetical protein